MDVFKGFPGSTPPKFIRSCCRSLNMHEKYAENLCKTPPKFQPPKIILWLYPCLTCIHPDQKSHDPCLKYGTFQIDQFIRKTNAIGLGLLALKHLQEEIDFIVHKDYDTFHLNYFSVTSK